MKSIVMILLLTLCIACQKEKLSDPGNVHQTMWWTNNKPYSVDLWIDKSASVMILPAGKTTKWDASNNNVYCIGRNYEIHYGNDILQYGVVKEINIVE